MASSSSTKATSLRVGVLIIPPVQFLDAAPIDLFGMCSPEYLQATSLPKPLLQLAIPVSIHYISASGPDTSAELTANAFLRVTASLSSPEVQPGKLDALLIPGPDPNLVPDEQYLDFIRAHDKAGQTDILVICTGSYAAGYAGILDGKRVSGPRGLLPELKKKFPKANYVERRYETDGRLWSAGGITNGLDLAAAYLHAKVQTELADVVCAMADVGDRGQDYDTGKAGNMLWWIWLILRSAVKGSKAEKTKKSQ